MSNHLNTTTPTMSKQTEIDEIEEEQLLREESDDSTLAEAVKNITIQGKEKRNSQAMQARALQARALKARAIKARALKARSAKIPEKSQNKVRTDAEKLLEEMVAAAQAAVAEEEAVNAEHKEWHLAVTTARSEYDAKLAAFRISGKTIADRFFAAIRNSRGHSRYGHQEYNKRKDAFLSSQREALPKVVPAPSAGGRWGRGSHHNNNRRGPY